MLQNEYLVAKIGVDTAENERIFSQIRISAGRSILVQRLFGSVPAVRGFLRAVRGVRRRPAGRRRLGASKATAEAAGEGQRPRVPGPEARAQRRTEHREPGRAADRRAAEDQRPASAPDDVRELDANQKHGHHDDDEERLLVASEELQRHQSARRDCRVLRRLREQERGGQRASLAARARCLRLSHRL